MTLVAKQNVIQTIDGKIKYRVPSEGGRERYHIGVWIDGPDEELDTIQKVEYRLHPSFNKPLRSSGNRKNNFSITFWTWGTFEIEVLVHKINGPTESFVHDMHFELPPDDGHTYQKV